MALGMAMTKLAALKNESDSAGSPVANMWWTHTPKPTSIVDTVEMATSVQPTNGRRQNTGRSARPLPRRCVLRRADALPVVAFDERRELRRRLSHHAVLNLRPLETAVPETLREQTHARPVPEN